MYGLVNRAIEGLVRQDHGEVTWNRIKERAGVEVGFFGRMVAYDDAITYGLVGAASEELGVAVPDLLVAFGRYWVRYVAEEGYGAMFTLGGQDLRTFLQGLDAMHSRVATGHPGMRPPSFLVEDDGEDVILHYASEREGLGPMVVGLVQGLADRFGETVTVAALPRDPAFAHDRFRICWGR